MNKKVNPTINQVITGLQQFYIEHLCPHEAKASKEFNTDLSEAYQSLVSHFGISYPDQVITDETFNDTNKAEFRFILFLYLMEPNICNMIMSIVGD